MVTSPSPGTIRMRFALVDAKIPNATVNTVATYTPYASTAYSLASLAFNNGVGYFAGAATAEGYAMDRRTGDCSGRPWTSAAEPRPWPRTLSIPGSTSTTRFRLGRTSRPRGCKTSAAARGNRPYKRDSDAVS